MNTHHSQPQKLLQSGTAEREQCFVTPHTGNCRLHTLFSLFFSLLTQLSLLSHYVRDLMWATRESNPMLACSRRIDNTFHTLNFSGLLHRLRAQFCSGIQANSKSSTPEERAENPRPEQSSAELKCLDSSLSLENCTFNLLIICTLLDCHPGMASHSSSLGRSRATHSYSHSSLHRLCTDGRHSSNPSIPSIQEQFQEPKKSIGSAWRKSSIPNPKSNAQPSRAQVSR